MVKIDTLFQTKTAKIPYPLAPLIPIVPAPPPSGLEPYSEWLLPPNAQSLTVEINLNLSFKMATNKRVHVRETDLSIQSCFDPGPFDTNSSSEIAQKF